MVDAVVVEDAALGLARVWAEWAKAVKAEAWADGTKAFKAEARECVPAEALADWAEV